ncbi:MAG: hypothetical protein K8T10_18370 [Candidatus Eremiobacteraeota bacterium]|nr:hypothetical protein [Candidatus Eremiobacteraeota bacterium]
MNKKYIPINKNINTENLSLIGGKGTGLARLFLAGAKIPKTICIPPDIDPGEAVRESLEYFHDPDGKKIYAVRSSAGVEDGSQKSYAGQFESFLRIVGVEAMVEAVNKCRDSGKSRRVREYSGNTEGFDVSVLIQEMIEADYSGVLFTCDPVSGSRNHVIIEALAGTSENLLGGTMSGENYVLDRKGDIIRSPESSSNINFPLKELVRSAIDLENKMESESFPGPLDFEWAVKSGEIFWLQVRPVTASGKRSGNNNEQIIFISPGEIPEVREDEIHWTSANAQEAVPGVITTLSEDVVADSVGEGFTETFRLLGVPMKKIKEQELVGIFDGRAFLNVTGMRKILEHLPLKNPDAAVKKLLIGSTSESPQVKYSLSLIPTLLNIVWRDMTLGMTAKKYTDNEYAVWKYPGKDELEKLDDRELWEVIDKGLDSREGFVLHVLGSMRYMNYFSFMEELCGKHNLNPSTLTQGLGTLRFASSAAALRDLAVSAGKIRERLFDENYLPVENWKEVLESDRDVIEFRRLFDAFIFEYGHLGAGTIEITGEPWRERPEMVLEIIGNLLKKGETKSRREYIAELSRKREESIRYIKKKLSLIDRIKFIIGLKFLHDSAPFRENLKFLGYRRIFILKEYVKEVGRRFAIKGIIDSPDDVFFLNRGELQKNLTYDDESSLKEKIRMRIMEHRKRESLPIPLHRVEGADGVRLYFSSSKKGGNEFTGLPASAGVARGKARVLLNLSEANRLQPGEILVTKNTDPSWTPLFSVAGGIVVEVGSMLSHGAVVAREVGIPAVVGIPGIVSLIRDGDRIIVDGTGGKISILGTGSETIEKNYAYHEDTENTEL